MKRYVAAVLFLSVMAPFHTANATNVTSKAGARLAIVNIQKAISESTEGLRDLGENAIVGNSKIAMKYAQRLEPLTQKWLSDKKAAEDRISASLADLNRQSNFIVLWENFVGCNAKQDKCIKGSVYNIPFDTKNEVNQSGFDRNILIGVIAPQDKLGYDKVRENYKLALENLPRLNGVYQEADYDLRAQILADYDLESERLKASIKVQKLALTAAKRASLASRDFETNFKIALQFQYNLDSLYLIGSSSFSQIDSYLDALNVVSASQAYSLGVGVSKKYQSGKATSFNRALGNVFTKDPEFKSLSSKAMSLYRGNRPTVPKAPAGQEKVFIVSTPNYTLSFTDQVLTAVVLVPPNIKNLPGNVVGIKGRLLQGDISLLSRETVQELNGNETVVNLNYDLSGIWTVLKSRNLPLRLYLEYFGSSGSGKSIWKEITLP